MKFVDDDDDDDYNITQYSESEAVGRTRFEAPYLPSHLFMKRKFFGGVLKIDLPMLYENF